MAQPLALSMVPESGELLIRGAEEPFLLESPTEITGTYDDTTGLISGLDLSTPQMSFAYDVGGGLVADIDVSFSPVAPGSGLLDAEGTLVLNATLEANLHIEVPDVLVNADCVTTVDLELTAAEPYSPDTGLVTVTDADFTIGEVPATPTCLEFPVATAVNGALAGAGHSLTFTLEGDMEPPVGGTEPNTTSLVVDPAGSASLGQEVTLTATVTETSSTHDELPTGLVTFLDGTKVLGRAPLNGGVAVLTSRSLRLGSHSLAAEYRGDSIYGPSRTAAAVPYTITATPAISADLPSYGRIGADPVEFDLTTDNPSAGAAVNNARIDVTIERWVPNAPTSPDLLRPQDVELEIEGPPGTWTQVPLSSFNDPDTPAGEVDTLVGSLWPDTGLPLALGEAVTDHLRISFPESVPEALPGPLDITFEVVVVDPGSGDPVAEEPLSSTTGRLQLYKPGRIQTEVFLYDLFGEYFAPSTVRQGGTVGFPGVSINPNYGQTFPSGTISARVDGVTATIFSTAAPNLSGPLDLTVPASQSGGQGLMINLPPSIAPGIHTLTLIYSGDEQFTPSSRSVQITVIEPISDRPYSCAMDIFSDTRRFNVQLRTHGHLPRSVASGTTVELDDFSFEIVADRSVAAYYPFDYAIGQYAEFEELILDMGPEGSGSATGATLDPLDGYPGGPAFEDVSDVTATFTGEAASVVVTGEPGEVVTPTIESITLKGLLSGEYPMEFSCVPVGEPFEFSPVTVAGTTLVVDGPDPIRADDEVTLTASVFPSMASGTVRFFDGETLLDIAPVQEGQAVTTVTLPEGDRSLTARFFAGVSAPSTTSVPVSVSVLPAAECPSFAEEGNEAVVRLVYLELLERCPDQAGFTYWVGRLDGGTSPEVFARTISLTPEAVGKVVDDAYRTVLDRAPDATGRAFWVERMRTGGGRYDELLADLASSPEFWSQSGSTRAGFVTRVYERLLDRVPDPGGLEYWTDRLASGTPRRALVLSLANEPEPLGRLVAAAYDEILGRVPGGSEQSTGTSFLRGTGDRSGLYAQLIGTDEFFDRAQGFPNPED